MDLHAQLDYLRYCRVSDNSAKTGGKGDNPSRRLSFEQFLLARFAAPDFPVEFAANSQNIPASKPAKAPRNHLVRGPRQLAQRSK